MRHPVRAQLDRTRDLYEHAYAHIMGRAVFEGMAGYFHHDRGWRYGQ
jgi:hypothetical protein